VLCRLEVPLRISFAASLGLVFAIPIWPYTGTFFSEIWTALLLLAALAFLEQAIRQGKAGISGVIYCGTCLGLALMSRPNHVVAVPVFAIAFLLAPLSKTLRVQQVLLLGANLALNYLHFHDVFQFGYAEQVEGGKILTDFSTPFHIGLYGLLFLPGKPLLLFAPPLLLALARHTQREAGYSWGPRCLLPVVPLLLVGMAPLLRNVHRNWPQRALVVLCVLGVLVNLPAVFTSFFEIQSAGGHYDESYDYLLDHNAVGSGACSFTTWEKHCWVKPMKARFTRGLTCGR
jgi:hypothetical protein